MCVCVCVLILKTAKYNKCAIFFQVAHVTWIHCTWSKGYEMSDFRGTFSCCVWCRGQLLFDANTISLLDCLLVGYYCTVSVNEESIAFRSDASCVKVVARLLIGRLVMIFFFPWSHDFSAFEAQRLDDVAAQFIQRDERELLSVHGSPRRLYLCWSGSIRCKSGPRKRMQAFGSLPRRSLIAFAAREWVYLLYVHVRRSVQGQLHKLISKELQAGDAPGSWEC